MGHEHGARHWIETEQRWYICLAFPKFGWWRCCSARWRRSSGGRLCRRHSEKQHWRINMDHVWADRKETLSLRYERQFSGAIYATGQYKASLAFGQEIDSRTRTGRRGRNDWKDANSLSAIEIRLYSESCALVLDFDPFSWEIHHSRPNSASSKHWVLERFSHRPKKTSIDGTHWYASCTKCEFSVMGRVRMDTRAGIISTCKMDRIISTMTKSFHTWNLSMKRMRWI